MALLLAALLGIVKFDALERPRTEDRLDEPFVSRFDTDRPLVSLEEVPIERARGRGDFGRGQQRMVDGIAKPGDDLDVGVGGIDSGINVGDPVERLRSESDDLLEDEVGAVEPERELVGPQGAKRLLATDELNGRVVGAPSTSVSGIVTLSKTIRRGLPARSSRKSVYSGSVGSSTALYSARRW